MTGARDLWRLLHRTRHKRRFRRESSSRPASRGERHRHGGAALRRTPGDPHETRDPIAAVRGPSAARERVRPKRNQRSEPMHDLILRGAAIYDGSGGPVRRGDVAVAGGRIAAVGEKLGGARETVDAGGLALAPGIVDTHTHYDAQLAWDPWATPSPALGVSTVIVGNCGFGIAPCRPPHRDMTARNLCNVEGMSIDALRAGARWDFETFPEYLDSVERARDRAERRRLYRPFRRPHMGHGRGGDRARRHRRRDPPKWPSSCAAAWRPAPSASPPPPSRATTATAESPCRRCWPRSARSPRWSARWRSPGAACSCSPAARRPGWTRWSASPPTPAAPSSSPRCSTTTPTPAPPTARWRA